MPASGVSNPAIAPLILRPFNHPTVDGIILTDVGGHFVGVDRCLPQLKTQVHVENCKVGQRTDLENVMINKRLHLRVSYASVTR